MATQIVSTQLKADTQEEYEKIKAMLAKLKLPAQPVYDDVQLIADIQFSTTLILQ